MKPLALPTLLAAALGHALPLKTGNTWTWTIRTPGSDTATGWVTATVVRSAHHDSGTAWTISVRDSSVRYLDTAIALERPDGSQAWLVGATALALELQPWDGSKLELQNHSSKLAPWGLESSMPGLWEWAQGYGYALQPAPGGRSNGGIELRRSDAGSLAALPEGVWIDTVGPVVFKSFGFSRRVYRMISYNGQEIDQSPYEPIERRPGTGTVLEWEEQTRSGVDLSPESPPFRVVHHWWTLLESASDSSGWFRWRVHDVSVDNAGGDADSILESRVQGRNWSSQVRRGECPTPEDAWIVDWSDSATPEGILRSSRTGYLSTVTGSPIGGTDVFEKIGTDGLVDSVSCASQSYRVGVYTTVTVRTLLAVDGKRIRNPTASTGIRGPRNRMDGNLRALANLPLDLVLRWTDPRGRSGTIRAGDVGRINRFCPHGPVFLRATLPDGTVWSESTFVP